MHRFLCPILLFGLVAPLFAAAQRVDIPEGTRVYLATDNELIGKKKKGVHEGTVVPCTVWRDVVVDGRVVVEAGTPATARVDSLKTAKVAGIKGKVSLAALETQAVDGKPLQLTGGYMKKGKGRIALSASLAAVVAWPLIFIHGKAAKLPQGTIFDAYTDHPAACEIPDEQTPVISLVGVASELTVEVLYDELENTEKPEYFDFLMTVQGDAPDGFVIDTLNGEPTEPLALEIRFSDEADGETTIRAAAKIRPLVKRFTKGINRFDVAFTRDGERIASEVVLNIQF